MKTNILPNVPHRTVVIDAVNYSVPRGVARNNRNRSWQIKVHRDGKVVLQGNFADDTYGSTEGALDAAKKVMAESPLNEEVMDRILRVNERVTLGWSLSGKGVISAVANVYSTHEKRNSLVYLISRNKMNEGDTAELRSKIVKALVKSWKQENLTEFLPLPELVRMEGEVEALMNTERFVKFCEAGQEIDGV